MGTNGGEMSRKHRTSPPDGVAILVRVLWLLATYAVLLAQIPVLRASFVRIHHLETMQPASVALWLPGGSE